MAHRDGDHDAVAGERAAQVQGRRCAALARARGQLRLCRPQQVRSAGGSGGRGPVQAGRAHAWVQEPVAAQGQAAQLL